jgi:Flp pilus assembly protein TadG
MLVVMIAGVVLFLGLAIDGGLAYLKRAQLAKAVDAATLTGMRNYALGQTAAKALAQNTFTANYGSTVGDANGPNGLSGSPSFSSNFTTDAAGNLYFTANASTTINTYFMRYFPQFSTVTVSNSAQVARDRLIMTLVLDKSGSMNFNGGCAALPPALADFIGHFDNTIDSISVVTFSTLVSTDVPMQTGGFDAPITSLIDSMNCVTPGTPGGFFDGGTFSFGGLQASVPQETSLTIPPGQNAVKVVVFLTDGWANSIQDVLPSCQSTAVDYGGCAPLEDQLGWCGFPNFWDPNTGKGVNCNVSTFPAQQPGNSGQFTEMNVSNDAMYRAEQVALSLRLQTPPTFVYSVGVGNLINQDFLYQVANDPNSSTYNNALPTGVTYFVPDCPSATCASEMDAAFQSLASRILLRLTQ